MAGEKSVLSGEDGQKITSRLLRLCGWNISEHIDFPCFSNEKHKPPKNKGGRREHSVDGINVYYSPLNLSVTKLILISSKHHADSYPSTSKNKIYNAIKEHAQCLDCARVSPKIKDDYLDGFDSLRDIEYDGLITFFSSDISEKHNSFFFENYEFVSIPSDNFDTLFFIDNKRATFLYSAISEARQYSSNREISFIYPDTGAQNTEDISVSGKILPLELMCSDVLPILVEKEENNHVLIFCNDPIEKKYLKRIFWLIHKLSGFAAKTIIFFPDYDSGKHKGMANSVKQQFQESDYLNKISLKKWDDYSFIKLKDSEGEYLDTARNLGVQDFPQNDQNRINGKISDDYEKILPFGSRIKPILDSSILGASDLKNFLKRKGIFVKYADKGQIIPLIANMLLSPNELDYLKGLLIDKEEKPKAINKTAPFIGTEKKLREVVLALDPKIVPLSGNCKHLKQPTFIPKGDNRYELEINIERTNTTKDLISGKTRHEGRLTISLINDKLNVKEEYTSTDTKKYLDQLSSSLNFKLKKEGCIIVDLKGIKFRDFKSNLDRVEFMTGFINIDITDTFFEGQVVNIKFKPDESLKVIPADLEPYRNKVRNLDINGSLLEELPHIEKDSYKNAILLSRIKIRYNFQIDGNKGACIASINFPSTLNGKKVDDKTDLVISVEVLKTRDSHIITNNNRLQNRLSRVLDQIVQSKYFSLYDFQ
ncbi:MAG: hypothetical protein KDC85_09530 [Saprospiraceae bacterium]|nr:hypothetical protein [Saprospiraceae bacterium]MCB9322964.1 hypothetical protein [Lewinellaceae bacterium]